MKLKVLEAYTRDVGRGICRIDYDSMDKLDISTGDIVKLVFIDATKNKHVSVAKALPLYPSDEGKDIVRCDGMIRSNVMCQVGSRISIKKTIAKKAIHVVVTPLEAIPPIDERYLADALESVPLIKGDKLMVPYFGGRITFKVLETDPLESVVVSQLTIFNIKDDPSTIVNLDTMNEKEKAYRFEKLHKLFQENKIDIVEFSDEIKGIQDENKTLKDKIAGLEAMLKGAQNHGKTDMVKAHISIKKLSRIQNIINEK